MLQFDIRGNLSPAGLIQSNLNEINQYLVNNLVSGIRSGHFQKYVQYSYDLKRIIGGGLIKQWINGSFVNSRKRNPKDIDFVSFIDHQIIVQLGNSLDDFRPLGSWNKYRVDAYIIEVYPIGTTLYKRFTLPDIRYWEDLFSNTRRNSSGEKFSKGFLEISY